MADAALSFAIEKLGDFLIQEVNVRIGVKDGVKWLKDELGYLLVSVRVAEEHAASAPKPEMDLIRQWINNVKDVANDAVIILERFSSLQDEHEAPKQGVLYRMLNFICKFCKKEVNLYDIGKEIESLKGRVVEIKNRHEQYGITNILTTPAVQQRKRPLLRATSFENLVDVVGFDDDVKTLLAELLKEDPSLNMISIHGMGGSGKSTLASKLYHSSELSHFESRAWVCVSQEYDIKDVLNKMIKSLVGHEVDLSKMDEVDLLRHLRKLLQDCDRYLAVIDDIWDIEVWEKIRKALPDNKNGSRVIVTTRNKKIAQKIDDRCFVHELRFLREDESWELFCKRAKPTRNLEKLGKEMVGKCGGLPLAIVVLSGLLLHKKSSDWFKVKDHIWRQLKSDSVEIKKILSLSYADLSFQMRQCFLYLARFPEDHNFEVNELKLLWIAEGFISEAGEGDEVVMEDVAEDYLNELVNRNMIQIVELLWDGQVQVCRVHDLVRDLAIQKAAEDKLLGIFDSKKLQTLCGAVIDFYELPKDICELKELRHLYFTQGVHFTQGVVGGNLNIGKQQTKLQTIEFIWYGDWIKIDTPSLTNLVTLGIRAEDKNVAYSLESIANLTSLEIFSLYAGGIVIPTLEPLSSCQRLKNVILQGKIRDPSILKFLPDSVTDLTLIDSMLVQDPMPTLGGLPNLTNLHLNEVYEGSEMICMVCGDDAFPSLQLLKLEYLYKLKEWQIEDGAMPYLKYLTIENCSGLNMVPKRLECLPSIPKIYSHWNRR